MFKEISMIAGLLGDNNAFFNNNKRLGDGNTNIDSNSAFQAQFMNAAVASLTGSGQQNCTLSTSTNTFNNIDGTQNMYSHGGIINNHSSSLNNSHLFTDSLNNGTQVSINGGRFNQSSSPDTNSPNSHSPSSADSSINQVLGNPHSQQHQDQFNGITGLFHHQQQFKTEQSFDVSGIINNMNNFNGHLTFPPSSLSSFTQLPFQHNTTSNFLSHVNSHQNPSTMLMNTQFSSLSNGSNNISNLPIQNKIQTIRRSRTLADGMVKCKYCPKKFQNHDVLRRHMGDCRSVRSHECSQCGKRFKARGGLQQHARIHLQERNYNCRYCPKKFNQKSHVDQHERIHTGSKPFTCQFCGRNFRQRSQQMGHEQTHFSGSNGVQVSTHSIPVVPEKVDQVTGNVLRVTEKDNNLENRINENNKITNENSHISGITSLGDSEGNNVHKVS
uniref:C2H2-type domain-containing protein n=2 Tax=Strongyloides stercoralis TaxID=6248 RepID=A0A0K0EDL4_STRER